MPTTEQQAVAVFQAMVGAQWFHYIEVPNPFWEYWFWDGQRGWWTGRLNSWIFEPSTSVLDIVLARTDMFAMIADPRPPEIIEKDPCPQPAMD